MVLEKQCNSEPTIAIAEETSTATGLKQSMERLKTTILDVVEGIEDKDPVDFACESRMVARE